MERLTITLQVQLNPDLHDLYIAALKSRQAGSVRDDRADYDREIERAENWQYDVSTLAALIGGLAGFQDITQGEGTPTNPVEVSDFVDPA